jgi:hypothetical protein
MLATAVPVADGGLHPYREHLQGGLVGALTGLTLLIFMTVPVSLLTLLGVPYAAPGGSFLVKLHPATWLLAVTLITLLIQRGNPLRALLCLLGGEPPVTFYLLVVATMMAWSVIRFGPSGAAFFIDTLLAAGFMVLILLQLDIAVRRKLFFLVCGILVANSCLGIAEQLTHWRLLPYTVGGNVELIEDVFRATALGGHPLTNAALTGMALFVFYRLKQPVLRALLCLLVVVALLSFGGRTALAVNLALFVPLMGFEFLGYVRRHGLSYREVMGGGAAMFLLLAALVGIVASGSVGQRILTSLTWDASAQVRTRSLDLFSSLPWPDLAFGMSPQAIAVAAAQVGIHPPEAAIESFWLVLALQVGVPLTVLFGVALVVLLGFLAWLGGRAIGCGLLGFVLVTSTSISLGVKSPLLVEVVAMALLSAAYQRTATLPSPTAAGEHGQAFPPPYSRQTAWRRTW